MVALRSVLAFVLLAVLTVGGVVLPSVHRAAHALELRAERDAHHDTHHEDDDTHLAPEADATPLATAPCAPLPHDVDCAVCGGVSVAADLAAIITLGVETQEGAGDVRADRVRTQTAWGAGARAPPVG